MGQRIDEEMEREKKPDPDAEIAEEYGFPGK